MSGFPRDVLLEEMNAGKPVSIGKSVVMAERENPKMVGIVMVGSCGILDLVDWKDQRSTPNDACLHQEIVRSGENQKNLSATGSQHLVRRGRLVMRT
jgi:hypothetical protein